jgi:hypothetical protein
MNSSYIKQTDSAQRVSVQSELIYAIWQAKAAYGDTEAMLEVRTSFVGNGAQVKLKGKTASGKNLGTMQTQIFNNRLQTGFYIPKNVPPDDFAYVEVQLPKHGLNGETNQIPTQPPIMVQQMQWSAQQARRGDVLTLTCDFQSAIPNDTEALVIIYEYDRDGSHDPIAKIPTTVQQNKIQLQWEYEYHEDTDEIPTQAELQQYGRNYSHPEYFFVVVIDGIRIGAQQQSGLLRFKDFIEIIVKDEFGDPLEKTSFTMLFADGTKSKGQTDANGTISIKNTCPGRIQVSIN